METLTEEISPNSVVWSGKPKVSVQGVLGRAYK